MAFTGKVVLVAGGTGGLGRAVSLAFLSEGAELIVTWRNESEFTDLKSAAGANSSRLAGYRVDVTDEVGVQQLVDAILAEKGRLDVMVNAVGGYAGGTKFWELDTRALDHMLALNLRSTFVLARAATKAMLPQGRGAIVNVASKAGLDHGARLAVYAASKAGALALMDSLAADLKGTGVRVNSILPSIIDTAPNREAMPNADFTAWPAPEDIARVVLFLCCDDSRVIHGASIPVYGSI
jgi:NAD(P)-dependent dehydrogenase (short-subunit alcohol dehydrogenase family)